MTVLDFNLLFLFLLLVIYGYNTTLGDNQTITMYYDEPVCDSAEGYESNYELCDRLYDEEEQDEKEHDDDDDKKKKKK